MKKQKELLFFRGIFIFIISVSLGVIVVTEKAGGLLIPKVQEKMISYLRDNYSNNFQNFIWNSPTYESTKYAMKVTDKENENHYFYVYYQKKETTDTYQEDYIEGKTLLENIQKNLEKEIQQKTNTACQVMIPQTLDQYTSNVQERILKEDNLLELKFYSIQKELSIKEWSEKEIITKINHLLETYQQNNITPKSYTIRFTNPEDITQSIQIQNIREDFLENPNQQQIIHDIIMDENSEVLKQNKITYKYLN